ncbi:MAG: OPT/YSL family transporter [Elusimicrobia bacterium]|nr:OPT/YSL family transporter [Elusimicrobiota bacterium]
MSERGGRHEGDSRGQAGFSLRAIAIGGGIGALLSVSNLYVGLKIGVTFGVAATASLVGCLIFKASRNLLPSVCRGSLSREEQACLQACSSSAGFATGAAMVSAVPAYVLVAGSQPSPFILAGLFSLPAVFGIFMGALLRRQMIVQENMKFPNGMAYAETIKSLESSQQADAPKARWFLSSALLGMAAAWCRDMRWPSFAAIPRHVAFPGAWAGRPAQQYTMGWDNSGVLLAAGALMDFRTAASLLAGSLAAYGLLAPWMVRLGAIESSHLGYIAIVQWSTWLGAPIMAASALTSLLLRWRSISGLFAGLADAFEPKASSSAEVQLPENWILGGILALGIGVAANLRCAFGAPWLLALASAVLLAVLSIAACRVTGESGAVPTGAMGNVTQICAASAGSLGAGCNLAAASMVASSAISSSDMLTHFRCGAVLGVNPRHQFYSCLCGAAIGTLAVMPAFYMLLAAPGSLGSDAWPAPAAQVWASIAKLLVRGPAALHPSIHWALAAGTCIGVCLPVLETLYPVCRKYLPSPAGLGLGIVLPFSMALPMFAGSLMARLAAARLSKRVGSGIPSIAAGIMAGESLMGLLSAVVRSLVR